MKHLALLVFLLINCSPAIASEAIYRMTQKGSVACLARAVYQEANTQVESGKEAVMAVIVNRAVEQQRHVCEVVRQPSQFSWVKHGTNVAKLTDSKEAEKFVLNVVAKTARVGYNSFRGAQYFYAHKQGTPVWANKMVCSRIEEHTFCVEKK
jgi:spore germination cell wall hydrolase CwlJ-like protein